jgi:hypothetical protein
MRPVDPAPAELIALISLFELNRLAERLDALAYSKHG